MEQIGHVPIVSGGLVRRMVATTVAVLLALTGLTTTAGAQVPETVLTDPGARYEEPLSMIGGVRELSDGRVIVSDPLEESLFIVEADLSSARKIGRNGQGPQEYGQPDGIFPLHGDSTLVVDLTNGRFARLAADGTFGEVAPIARDNDGEMVVLLPRAVDGAGNIYFQPMRMRPGQAPPDSADVARWNAGSETVDVIAKVGRPKIKTSSSGGANNRSEMMRPVPLSPQDAWAVSADGRVAIARAADYRVEWVSADGSVVSGPPVPYEPVRIRKADKEEWASTAAGGIGINVNINNGVRQTSFRRGGMGGAPDIDGMEWPEVKPAFASIRVSPDGHAWVRRYVSAGDPERYDVFDGEGRLVHTVVMPAGTRLEAFGAGSVYVSRRDDLDFQWLARYELETS